MAKTSNIVTLPTIASIIARRCCCTFRTVRRTPVVEKFNVSPIKYMSSFFESRSNKVTPINPLHCCVFPRWIPIGRLRKCLSEYSNCFLRFGAKHEEQQLLYKSMVEPLQCLFRLRSAMRHLLQTFSHDLRLFCDQ